MFASGGLFTLGLNEYIYSQYSNPLTHLLNYIYNIVNNSLLTKSVYITPNGGVKNWINLHRELDNPHGIVPPAVLGVCVWRQKEDKSLQERLRVAAGVTFVTLYCCVWQKLKYEWSCWHFHHVKSYYYGEWQSRSTRLKRMTFRERKAKTTKWHQNNNAYTASNFTSTFVSTKIDLGGWSSQHALVLITHNCK